MKKIIPVFYSEYGRYINRFRAMPSFIDGLKPVERRVLLSLYKEGRKKAVKSATIVGHCFVAGSLISTNEGLNSLEKIQSGDTVHTQENLCKVANSFISSNKDNLYELILENGLTNVCTKDQKFKVFTPDLEFIWKKVIDIDKNDYIVTKCSAKNNKTDYVEVNGFHIDEDIAYIAGLFITDGFIDRDPRCFKIGFCADASDYSALIKVQKIIKERSGITFNIFTKNSVARLRITQDHINTFLIDLLDISDKKSITAEIPEVILKSPSNVVWSFISGMIDGDGCIALNKRKFIDISTTSKKLSEQVQVLLMSHGIFSTINKQLRNRNSELSGNILKNNTEFLYHIMISGGEYDKLLPKLSLASVSKNLKLQIKSEVPRTLNYYPSKYEILPYVAKFIFDDIRNKHLGGGWYLDIKTGNKIRSYMKYSRSKARFRFLPSREINNKLYISLVNELKLIEFLDKIGSKYYDVLKYLIDNDLRFIKMKSINEVPFEKTYDIEVEKDHEFICNGMIVHNCLGHLHPHGDQSLYGTLVNIANQGYAKGEGNWGSPGLEDAPPAAHRYTEVSLKKWVDELAFTYLDEKYVPYQEFELEPEPIYLPSPIPIGLIGHGVITGISFYRTLIPKYKLSDLSKRLSWILHGKKKKEEIIIQPNSRDCTVSEAEPGEFQKILTTGIGSINYTPHGKLESKNIRIQGRAPNSSFNILVNDQEKLDINLIDNSSSQIDILVEPKKKSTNLQNLATTVWQEYLIKKLNFNCLFCDNEGNVEAYGIDNILAYNYNLWKYSVQLKNIDDFNKLSNRKVELMIVQIIRYIFEQYKSNTVEEIITHFKELKKNTDISIEIDIFDVDNDIWKKEIKQILEQDIIDICNKRTIKNLVETVIDIQKVEKELLSAKSLIDNCEKNCLDFITELSKGTA